MKKVLLFARDPGGANQMCPIFNYLLNTSNKADIYIGGKDKARDVFLNNHMDKYTRILSYDEAVDLITNNLIDLIITGTSADDLSEFHIWQLARIKGIKTVAIIDQWVNYGIRFSGRSVEEMLELDTIVEVKNLPDYIFTMDEWSKRELIRCGIPEMKIRITGNIYLESIIHHINNISEEDVKAFKLQNSLNTINCIMFISEPITDVYKGNADFWGYDEMRIFGTFFSTMEEIAKIEQKVYEILVKIHPKETSEKYEKYIGLSQWLEIVIIKVGSPYLCLQVAKAVFGMSSMLLLEAAYAKKPFLSIQIGLCQKDPFILDQLGFHVPVLGMENLAEKIKETLYHFNYEQLPSQEGGLNRTVCELEEILCQF